MKSFCGLLTRVDCWSDTSPSGARGRRVWITREAAIKALSSFPCSPLYNQHSDENPIAVGIINWADIIGNEIWIAGELWGEITDNELSYEIVNCKYTSDRTRHYIINKFTFVGAAVVPKGAYRNTWIEILEESDVSYQPTAQDCALLQRGYFRQRVSSGSKAKYD